MNLVYEELNRLRDEGKITCEEHVRRVRDYEEVCSRSRRITYPQEGKKRVLGGYFTPKKHS